MSQTNSVCLEIPLFIQGEMRMRYDEILTPEALEFIFKLEQKFGQRRLDLLYLREQRQREINYGKMPDFLPETEAIRKSDWQVAPIPPDLEDRRVEITGPVDRKMIINALNSGANVFMADFEDSNSPTWQNIIEGQINLRDAVEGTITYSSPEGKFYQLEGKTATLMVRPRGWHLNEKNILVEGAPMSASLVDFGLFFFHNAVRLIEKGTGPYFYLPKLENHLEARLWNDVFVFAQEELGIPRGTIRATVLIENVLAAFEMEEILYELREHSAGLNCGRWDYIFSFIKKFHRHPEFVLPDRAEVTMTTHFMRSYSLLLIQTCHRRGAHAMGGMAAQIPIKNNPQANEEALLKVRQDKEREVSDGHDGTWVAHPGLVPIAKEIFDKYMPTPNQIRFKRDDIHITAADLLEVAKGNITEKGVQTNIDVGLQYLESWLRGSGCVPIYNLMEDAATAEISRTQLWQWIHQPAGKLPDGRKITAEMCRKLIAEELTKIRRSIGEARYSRSKFKLAGRLFERIITEEQLAGFLTLIGYQYI